MDQWDCTVRMPSNRLQHIVVEAYDYSDARSIAESSTGGKLIQATCKYTSSFNNDDKNNESSTNGSGILFLLVLVFVIFSWKYMLLFGGVALVMWFLWKNW